MFIDFISQLLETLVNADVAEMFSAPLALLLVFILMFGLFTMFSGSSVKKLVLTFILIVVLVFCIFSMASHMGFITLPVTLGGT